MRLKKGDPVVVIAGNEKGKEGIVLALKGNRVLVQNVNKRKKHQKSQDKKSGTIVEFEVPIHISNVMYSHEGKGCKMRTRLTADGHKEIYVKTKNNEEKVIRTIS